MIYLPMLKIRIAEKQIFQTAELIQIELRKLKKKTWQFPLIVHLKQASVKSLPMEGENIKLNFVDHLIQQYRIVDHKQIQSKVL